MNSPKVYLTNDPGRFDFGPATHFGELVKVTSGRVDHLDPNEIRSEVELVMSKFNIDTDYLVPAGSLLATSMAYSYLTAFEDKPVRTLLYDTKRKEYTLRLINLF